MFAVGVIIWRVRPAESTQSDATGGRKPCALWGRGNRVAVALSIEALEWKAGAHARCGCDRPQEAGVVVVNPGALCAVCS